MKVALHAGQLLQPVPGGIGRYTHSLLRMLPDGRRRSRRVRGRRPPAGRARAASRGSTSARRTAACATSAGTGFGRPSLDIDADVIHAPSLAVPPVRDAALVVTVHDIAFLRVPDVTTRRGVSFHRRALARRAPARRSRDRAVVVHARWS